MKYQLVRTTESKTAKPIFITSFKRHSHPSWNFFHNADVLSSTTTAAFSLLWIKYIASANQSYLTPILYLSTPYAFGRFFYSPDKNFNYELTMELTANVGSLLAPSLMSGIMYSSVGFFPAMATAAIAGIAAIGITRGVARIGKLFYDEYTDNSQDNKKRTPSLPEPWHRKNVFQNSYVMAGMSSGIGFACYQNQLLDELGLGIYLSVSFIMHAAFNTSDYVWCCSKKSDWTARNLITDMTAIGLATFLPLAFTATFAATGAAATVISGTATIIAINIAAAAATKILSECCATLFYAHQDCKGEKQYEKISDLEMGQIIPHATA